MASRAADLMFRCVLDGSLSMSDMDIDRRPYHRNCKCALHKVKCSNSDSQHRNNISFPKREFTDKCCLSVSASTISSQHSLTRNRGTNNEVSTRVYVSSECINVKGQ